jgi:hypothetical protein
MSRRWTRPWSRPEISVLVLHRRADPSIPFPSCVAKAAGAAGYGVRRRRPGRGGPRSMGVNGVGVEEADPPLFEVVDIGGLELPRGRNHHGEAWRTT